MPTQIEAKRLSGVDRGKHVRVRVPGGRYTGTRNLEGELVSITHHGGTDLTDIIVLTAAGPRQGAGLPADTIVTITGKPS